MEVVINTCIGGFGLSDDAMLKLAGRKGITVECRVTHGLTMFWNASEESYFTDRCFERHDTDLIAIIREMGEAANGEHADLKIVSIPDDVGYYVDEYNGPETIHENHRTWC